MNDVEDEDGTAVIVDGKVVAWFSVFDDAAVDWCRDAHFGRWLTWRARCPAITPITPEQLENAQQWARKMAALFEEEAPP